ncbi:MAG: hypothetical protein U0T74_02485 [Chitinophagales bacterium]
MMNYLTTFKISVLFFALFVIQTAKAQAPALKSNKDVSNETFDIKFQNLEGVKHLLIGFKKQEGEMGNTYILNSSGEVMHKQENFEMIFYPAYNAVDVSKYKQGLYTIRVVTAQKNQYEIKVAIE